MHLISSSLTDFDYSAHTQLALQVLFEEETVFQSQEQLSAVVTVLETDINVLICLLTASEKSLIIFLPVFLIRDRVIIVVMLFIMIHSDLQACVSAQSLQSIVFSLNCACEAPLIFITLKVMIMSSFFTFLYELTQNLQLHAVIFDECHIITDTYCEANLQIVNVFNNVSCKWIFMSMTNPVYMKDLLTQQMQLKPDHLHMTAVTNCLNISHQIWCLSWDSHEEVVHCLVIKQQQ